MPDIKWDMVSALGQVAAALISLVGLPLILMQLRSSKKIADIQDLLSFQAAVTGQEVKIFESRSDPDIQIIHLTAFMNFLEIHAAALNAGLYGRVSSKLIEDKIFESYNLLTESEKLRQQVGSMKVNADNFQEVEKVYQRRKVRAGLMSKIFSAISGH